MVSRIEQKPRDRAELGQAIVLIALMMTLFLGLASFAIDGAHLFVEEKHMQNAADAASLAAARVLPFDGGICAGNYQTDPPSCANSLSVAAMTYSNYNGGPDSLFPPCSGPSDTDCYDIHYGSPGSPGTACDARDAIVCPGADHRNPEHLPPWRTRYHRPGERFSVGRRDPNAVVPDDYLPGIYDSRTDTLLADHNHKRLRRCARRFLRGIHHARRSR